jgi:F-type H+-transporting ATPase subunit b
MFVTEAFAEDAVTAPAAEATHAGTGVAHETGVFPPFDSSNYPSQILWLAITFGLFYIFLKRVILPQVGGILTTRDSRIKSDLAAAEKMKAEADAAVAAYEQELAAAKANADDIAVKAGNEAKADASAKRQTAEKELDKKIAAAEAKIASIKAAGMKEVGAIAQSTVTEIIKQLTGVSAPSSDVAGAVKAAGG